MDFYDASARLKGLSRQARISRPMPAPPLGSLLPAFDAPLVLSLPGLLSAVGVVLRMRLPGQATGASQQGL